MRPRKDYPNERDYFDDLADEMDKADDLQSASTYNPHKKKECRFCGKTSAHILACLDCISRLGGGPVMPFLSFEDQAIRETMPVEKMSRLNFTDEDRATIRARFWEIVKPHVFAK